MREIKFRVWDKEEKEMFYFGLNDISNDGLLKYDPIKYSETSGCLYIDNCGATMQYTGLKDKNGKEIYEGDILNKKDDLTKTNHRWIVEWGDKGFKDNKIGLMQITPYGETEVIGNVFENPDLLTLKKEN